MNIVELVTPEKAYNKETVKLLSDFLKLAKSGEVAEVALVAVYSDYRHEFAFSPSRMVSVMLGGVARLQHRLCEAIGEIEDEAPTPEI